MALFSISGRGWGPWGAFMWHVIQWTTIVLQYSTIEGYKGLNATLFIAHSEEILLLIIFLMNNSLNSQRGEGSIKIVCVSVSSLLVGGIILIQIR